MDQTRKLIIRSTKYSRAVYRFANMRNNKIRLVFLLALCSVFFFVLPDSGQGQSAPVINQPATCYGDPVDPKVDLTWSNTGASSYTLKSCIWSSCDSQRDVPGCINITGTSCTDNDASPADMYYWVRDNTTGLESNRIQVECLTCRLINPSNNPPTANVGDTVTYLGRARTVSYTFAGGGNPPGQSGPASNYLFSTVFNTLGTKQVTVISPQYTQAINCPVINILATPSLTPIPPTPIPSVSSPPPIRYTTPPEISNVRILNITQTGATVLWNTDEPADSQVEYCITASRCNTFTALNQSLTTQHSVNLSGLTPDKYYYIWARSKDASGNLRILGYYLFKTLAVNVPTSPMPTPRPSVTLTPRPSTTPTPTPIPINPPVISNVQITNITRDSATVTWETDRPADSRVITCIIIGLWCSLLGYDSNLVTQHSLILSNLIADKMYKIKVYSKDSNGIQGKSDQFSFKTELGLIISDAKILNITRNSISVTWKTNYPASSALKVCIFIFWCWGGGSAYNSNLVFDHTLMVSNLRNNTRYGYRAESVDLLGYKAYSKAVYFQTLP